MKDIERNIDDISPEIDVNEIEKLEAQFATEYSKGLINVKDDRSVPQLTVRAIFLGCLWAIFLACANAMTAFRNNTFLVPTALASIASYPMGLFLAAVLPKGILNPGPFSVKEHVLVYVIAGSAGGQPYGINNVVAQKLFFEDTNVTILNALAWVCVTQMVGYGIAGLCRRFLVKPTAMLWPGVLPTVAFFNAFHDSKALEDPNGKYFHSMSRYTAFWFAFTFMFVYSWLPAYFAPALSFIAVLCWFPVNRTWKFLGSGTRFNGPGIGALTFDWTQINYWGAAISPWYTTVNFAIAAIFWGWIVGPLMHFTKAFGRPDLQPLMNYGGSPINSGAEWKNATVAFDPIPIYNINKMYDIDGYEVKVTRGKGYPKLLDMNNNLNEQAYERAGKTIYLTAHFSLIYFASFISLGAVFSQVALWYGKDVYRQFKEAMSQTENDMYKADPHYRIMASYPEVPEWGYLSFLAFFTVAAIVVCQFTPYRMDWWVTVVCILTGILFIVPIGIIQAITGYQPGLNILTQVISGLMIPGKTVGVMAFKSLGYDIVIQGLNLTLDLKLGHYMHINPIFMVSCQMIGTVVGACFNTFVAFWVMANVDLNQKNSQWSGNGFQTFANAGGIWGAIGPARFFGPSSPYWFLNLGYIIGFIGPFIPWTLNKIFPHKNWRKINVVLLAAAQITMASGSNQNFIVTPVIFGFIFQYYLYNCHREFWDKYTWGIVFAFDASAAVVAMIQPIFASFELRDPIGLFSPAAPLDYYCLGMNYLGEDLSLVNSAAHA